MLALVLPSALVPFATVHPLARGLVAVVAGVLGGLALLWGVRQRRPSSAVFGFVLLGFLAIALSVSVLVPVSADTRALLQPGLAEVINGSLAIAGVERAPLGVDAYNALLELAVSAYFLVFAGGVALAVRSSERAGSVAWVVSLSAVALVIVAAAHRITRAKHIWWISTVPAFSRDPFFGTFVNPNDGGLFCATALVFTAGLALRHSGSLRALAGGALVALAAGVRVSGSRGAMLAGAAGLLVFAWVAGGRRVRLAISGLVGLGLVGVLLQGPREVAEALSLWLLPEALGPGEDVYTGRGEVNFDTLALIAAAPFAGVGYAGFDDAFHVVKSTPTFATTVHAHQELLQAAAEHGVPVLLLWLLAIALLIGVTGRAAIHGELSRRRLALLAGAAGAAACIGVGCFFSFPLRIGAIEVLLALAVGSCLGLASGEDRNRLAGSGRVLTVCAGLLFSGGLLAQGGAIALADSEDSLYGSAEIALASGDERMRSAEKPAEVERALQDYRLALARAPLRRDTLQKLSRAEFARAEFKEATKALVQATRVYPTLPWPWRDLARLQRRLGDYEDSWSTWRAMLACDLPDGDDRIYVAEALRGPGDPATIAALALPERADRLAAGARELEGQEAFATAEQLYRRAAALNPRYQAHLGAALLRWERPAAALEVTKGEPETCFSLRVRADALHRLKRFDDALVAWQAALDLCGNDDAEVFREIRLGTSRARVALKDPRGLTTLDAMLREDPQDVQVQRALLSSLRELGLEGRLVQELDKLVREGRATPAERAEYEALTRVKR